MSSTADGTERSGMGIDCDRGTYSLFAHMLGVTTDKDYFRACGY